MRTPPADLFAGTGLRHGLTVLGTFLLSEHSAVGQALGAALILGAVVLSVSNTTARKETTMPDLTTTPRGGDIVLPDAAQNALLPPGHPFEGAPADGALTTAGADQPQLFPTTLDVHPQVAAIVGAVQSTSPPESWAMTAAVVLQALQPTQDAWMTVSRASPKTQMTVQLAEHTAIALAGILQLFFPHPKHR